MNERTVPPKTPDPLLIGRDSLNRIEEIEVIEDLKWHQSSKQWVLHLRLNPSESAFNNLVPRQTEWFVFLSPQYPFGEINFFPSNVNSIEHTFPHQVTNIADSSDEWRTGKICLSDPYAIFEDSFLSKEPQNAEQRLFWHVKRALGWLEHASKNELLAKGHFFELPVFGNIARNYSLIAFSESKNSFETWKDKENKIGFFEYSVLPTNEKVLLVKKFLGSSKKPILGYDWGSYVKKFKILKGKGIWIRVNSLPVIPPWQAPLTWGELILSLQKQDVDLLKWIDSFFSNRRKRERINSVAVIGFPIPNKIGEDYERYHWQGLELPGFFFADSPVNGYRPGKGAAGFANQSISNSSAPVLWIKSENWTADQIRTRGALPSNILDKRVLIIGAGAFGSAVAEMLVRGGLEKLTICDGDEVMAGNLVRHTLDLRHVTQNKAIALASHLNQLSPSAKVNTVRKNFPPQSGFYLQDYDLVIDCSASQAMLASLADFESANSIDFVSLSMSFAAKRLYFFSTNSKRFPFEKYKDYINPWLEIDFRENKDEPAPREGIGCWHPVFPARSDDIWLLASAGFKVMIQALDDSTKIEQFKVFEQAEGELFGGIKEVFLD